MSVVVRPTREHDVEGIVTLLSTRMNPRIPPARWRRLFDYPWRPAGAGLGRIAVDGEDVVGTVATVHADRTVGERTERVVNICAWYLDKAYRGRGVGIELMRRATEDDGMSYTILTSSAKTPPILAAVGYRVLDAARRVWRRRDGPRGTLSLLLDPARIAPALSPSARRLVEDHAGMPVIPALATAADGACFILLARSRKGDDVEWWDVLHASDRRFLAERGQEIADALLPEGANAVLGADSRFLVGTCRSGASLPLAVPRFCKSARLGPEALDNLYSELQLLNLKLD
jgi:GNAT superfamily N-acetyltransferase